MTLSCHLVIESHISMESGIGQIQALKKYLAEEFNITHATVELETTAQCPCTSLLCQEALWDSAQAHLD